MIASVFMGWPSGHIESMKQSLIVYDKLLIAKQQEMKNETTSRKVV